MVMRGLRVMKSKGRLVEGVPGLVRKMRHSSVSDIPAKKKLDSCLNMSFILGKMEELFIMA